MAMVIQHNLSAINANRMDGIVEINLSKSAEKLSSGYRINRAADDAAGFSMSEKMRRQIRGLSQASDNAQDGISMVQTAEGALHEVNEMLHRMNELCVKAANGTLKSDDRGYIQDEISQITKEIDRVGVSTSFNNIMLLDGLPQTKATAVAATATVNGGTGQVTQATENEDAKYTINNLQRGDVVYIPANGSNPAKYLKYASDQDVADYNQQWANYESSGGTAPTERDGSTSDKAKLVTSENELLNEIAWNLLRVNLAANTDVANGASARYTKGASQTVFDIHFSGPLPITLQVGSEKGHTFSFEINAVSASTLGVADINVKDEDGSGGMDGIEKVKNAINTNSMERAKLGAVQNRLEHIIKNLDNVVENTTASESRIRDTDMASEMQYYANTKIIAQAGQTVLAQANQSKQGVLNLLQ